VEQDHLPGLRFGDHLAKRGIGNARLALERLKS
jgi:hypothetical protein